MHIALSGELRHLWFEKRETRAFDWWIEKLADLV
jgi:hypothetical protein